MPQLFKANGYKTASIGKVYHSTTDDAENWSTHIKKLDNFYVIDGNKEKRFAYEAGEVEDDFPKAMIIESEGGWRKAGAHPIASVCDALNETGRNFFREQREKYGKVNFLKWSDWKRNSTKGNNEASIVTIEETIPSFAVQKYEVKWANE